MNTPARRRSPTMSDIRAFQEEAAKLPQVQYRTEHHHSEGTYVREFHMPAGHFVIGKEHKHRHLNILVKGRCTFWTVQEQVTLDAGKGPITFESMASVKKIVYAHTDIVWMTVHPTDETNQDRLEFEFINPEEQGNLFPELDAIYLGGKYQCLGDLLAQLP